MLHLEICTFQGNMAVVFRFGTCPTGIRVTSFIALISTTETLFEPALATYASLPSGEIVTQSGERPTSVDPRSFKSGSEYMYTALLSLLLTTSTFPSGVTAIP